MSSTPRLALPCLAPAQAQKHVTVNEALRKLDAVVQLGVLSRTVVAEPSAPAEGDAYILPAGKTGPAWGAMADGALAAWSDGAWSELTPQEGWRAWVHDTDEIVFHDGATWTAPSRLGVNAAADATNRLAVRSNAVLFDAIDAAEGGSGDSQVKVNKEAAGDTASHLFQTGFSGRAEFGLTGDDDFHLKVSADGAAWKEALRVGAGSGFLFVPDAGRLNFEATINGAPANFYIDTSGSSGKEFTFAKVNDDNDLANGSLFVFAAAGGKNTGNPFWQGVQFACTTVTEGGANRFPRFSFYWSYTNTADPTDLRFNIKPGNAGTLKTQFNIETQQGGEIWLNGGNVRVGSTAAAPVCKLDVDGPVKVKSYAKASLPSAAAGAGQVIYVSDEAGGATIAFSDGTSWRRVADRAVVS